MLGVKVRVSRLLRAVGPDAGPLVKGAVARCGRGAGRARARAG